MHSNHMMYLIISGLTLMIDAKCQTENAHNMQLHAYDSVY